MLTTHEAAARLNRRAMERGEPRRYTAKHVAALCGSGKLAGVFNEQFRRWTVDEAVIEAYAAADKPRGGRPRKGAK